MPDRTARDSGVKRAKAVALRYEPGLPAPFLAAKASGRAVERLVAIAEEAGVPELRDALLTEALFPLDLGAYIPEDYYEIVAKVFMFVRSVEEA
jgi:type III secretion system FlhB-like substrate exporter